MKFEDVIKNIESFDNEKNLGFFSADCMDKIKKSYTEIMLQIDNLKNDKELEVTEAKKLGDLIIDTYIDIQNAFTFRPIKREYKDFVNSFGELIINWNNNTLNNTRIVTLVTLVNRFLDAHYTLLETSKELRKLNDYFSRMRGWMPTALDIQKTYFDMLVEDNITK